MTLFLVDSCTCGWLFKTLEMVAGDNLSASAIPWIEWFLECLCFFIWCICALFGLSGCSLRFTHPETVGMKASTRDNKHREPTSWWIACLQACAPIYTAHRSAESNFVFTAHSPNFWLKSFSSLNIIEDWLEVGNTSKTDITTFPCRRMDSGISNQFTNESITNQTWWKKLESFSDCREIFTETFS